MFLLLVYSGYYHLDQKSMTGIAVGVGIALTCILICVLILIYRSKARCVSIARHFEVVKKHLNYSNHKKQIEVKGLQEQLGFSTLK